MLIKAYSRKEAVSIAKQGYNCSTNVIDVTPVKEPINLLWGLIKIKGEFKADVRQLKKQSYKKNKNSPKDGHIMIKNGIIKVTNPTYDGRYPYIIADDKNICVHVNGEEKTGSFVVTEEDEVKLEPLKSDPITKVSVYISEDNMKAVLNIKRQEGKKFYIKDAKDDIKVEVISGFERIEPQNVTFVECIMALIAAGVKMDFIDTNAVEQLVNSNGSVSTVVAKGRQVIEGQKTQIKYYFSYLEQNISNFSENIDIENDTRMTSQIGDVLAAKFAPAMQGKDGITVTGDIVKAQIVEDKFLRAGQGVAILDNGTKAVALINGRPVLKNDMISVIPLLIVPGDVNEHTGNIKFDGDVFIKGNVMDNMSVYASGAIKITGSIYNSEVCSSNGMNVLGKVIGSKIRSGVSMINCFYVIPQLEIIQKFIFKLINCMKFNSEKNVEILQRIIYSENAQMKKSQKKLLNLLSLMEYKDVRKLSSLLKEINDLVMNIDLSYDNDIKKVSNIYDQLNNYIESIKDLHENDADISTQYVQNSTVQACGNIILTEYGSYQSNLFAKEKIVCENFKGNIMGGILVAGKGISAGCIGSKKAEIRTYCKILNPNGVIDARLYSGTVVNTNNNCEMIKT